MRILHILNRLSSFGNGIVNLAVDVALEQKKAGHVVAFLTGPDGGYETMLRSSGVEVYSNMQEQSLGNLLPASFKSRQVLREFKPDIVHAHMQTALLLVIPWTKLYGIPMVGHLHNVHDKSAHRMSWADRLITVSESVQQSMLELGVPAAKLRTVLNGTVRSPRVPSIAELVPEPLLRPAILTVAGMSHRKGISELIQAFEVVGTELSDAHLYLAGIGPEKPLFEQQAADSPLSDRIHFLGFTSIPQRLMLSSDVFVLASRRDSFGLVLAEAREAGCAIVASDVDGIPEALDGGEAGILVPAQSPKALADAILGLLKDDKLRQEWRRKAGVGLERFTVARMTQEVMDVYKEVVR